jgi:hypothetical protein
LIPFPPGRDKSAVRSLSRGKGLALLRDRTAGKVLAMNDTPVARLRAALLVLAAALAIGACSSSAASPTSDVIQSPQATPSVAETVTDVPTAPPTDLPVPPTAVTSATTAATASPPVATSGPASACTGTPANQAFFVEAASRVRFEVYCAVLPSGWLLNTGDYKTASGGQVTVQYKGPGGATIEIAEGAYCTTSPVTCSSHVSSLGNASFGDLTGALDLAGASPVTYALYVAPGTAHGYGMSGTGMGQPAFVAYAAAMVKVPAS